MSAPPSNHLTDKRKLTASTELQSELRHNSYSYTNFWGSYKKYVQGALGGIFIGGILGALIGLGAFGITATLAPILAFSMKGVSFSTLVGSMSVLGMLKGFHEFSVIGANAGTGVALDEFEVRQNRATNRKLGMIYAAVNGSRRESVEEGERAFTAIDEEQNAAHGKSKTPHQDAMTHPTTKLFHWKVAAIGLAVGLLAGAALVFGAPALAGLVFHTEALQGIAVATDFFAGTVAAKEALGVGVAIAASCGLFGASFGIDRIVGRKAFDFTDKLFYGKIGYSKSKDGPGKAGEHPQEKAAAPARDTQPAAPEPEEHVGAVSRLRRTAESRRDAEQPRFMILAHKTDLGAAQRGRKTNNPQQGTNWKIYLRAEQALAELDPGKSMTH